MDVTDPFGITKQVSLLESITHGLSEAYRLDLETELVKESVTSQKDNLGTFIVQKLSCYDWAKNPEDYFYTLKYEQYNLPKDLKYKERDFGIILPIPHQALIGNNFVDDFIFQLASGVLNKRGYSVSLETDDTYNLIKIAQQKRSK